MQTNFKEAAQTAIASGQLSDEAISIINSMVEQLENPSSSAITKVYKEEVSKELPIINSIEEAKAYLISHLGKPRCNDSTLVKNSHRLSEYVVEKVKYHQRNG